MTSVSLTGIKSSITGAVDRAIYAGVTSGLGAPNIIGHIEGDHLGYDTTNLAVYSSVYRKNDYIKVTVDFPLMFNGVNYGSNQNGGIWLSTNGYLVFGQGGDPANPSNDITTDSTVIDTLPFGIPNGIFFGAGDSYCTQIKRAQLPYLETGLHSTEIEITLRTHNTDPVVTVGFGVSSTVIPDRVILISLTPDGISLTFDKYLPFVGDTATNVQGISKGNVFTEFSFLPQTKYSILNYSDIVGDDPLLEIPKDTKLLSGLEVIKRLYALGITLSPYLITLTTIPWGFDGNGNLTASITFTVEEESQKALILTTESAVDSVDIITVVRTETTNTVTFDLSYSQKFELEQASGYFYIYIDSPTILDVGIPMTVDISGVGMLDMLEVTPETLVFPPTEVGQVSTARITLRNKNPDSFLFIDGFQMTSSVGLDFFVLPNTFSAALGYFPYGMWEYDIYFMPTHNSTRTASFRPKLGLNFFHNVEIALTGDGVKDGVTEAVPLVNFENVSNFSTPVSVTGKGIYYSSYKNIGKTPFVITGYSFSSPVATLPHAELIVGSVISHAETITIPIAFDAGSTPVEIKGIELTGYYL